MDRDFARYAVFYAPPEGEALERFGGGWLAGAPVPPVDLPPARIRAATATPARYGFHGTLKPPFALAAGRDVDQLRAALATLAGRLAPARMAGLDLRAIGRFLALVPRPDDAPIRPVAAACVEALDDFRAPPPADEIARRRAAGLSARQEALLARWGYPYVMEEFRFHLTLTGALDDDERAAVAVALGPAIAPLLAAPFTVEALTLFGDPGRGRPFARLESYPLTGGE